MLTYCTNIHTAETWADLQRELRATLPVVRPGLLTLPGQPAPLGLWLSEAMLDEIDAQGDRAFRSWCAQANCQVAALNGFPFGRFHGEQVKERVYRPDWRSPQRVEHTLRLAERLASWLPAGAAASVTTVPLGWRDDLSDDDLPLMHGALARTVAGLEELRQRTGRSVSLAIEPEPGCWLETVTQAAAFVATCRLPADQRDLLGVCLDACHEAVMFQEPEAGLAALRQQGVRLLRVQATAGLRYRGTSPRWLHRFAKSVYLHQTLVRSEEGTAQFSDLPAALAEAGHGDGEWRVHVHVPVSLQRPEQNLGAGLDTTIDHLRSLLAALPAGTPVELETYGWEILPQWLRPETLAIGLLHELRWLRQQPGPWEGLRSSPTAPKPGGPGRGGAPA